MLDFFKSLAQAYFTASADAITKYPFTTIIVIFTILYYMQINNYARIVIDGRPNLTDHTLSEIINLLIGFVVAV
jgi:hypothetical protein